MITFKRLLTGGLICALLVQPVQAESARQLLNEMQKALELTQPQLQFTRSAPAAPQSFVPEGRTLENYPLGAGDGLELSLWGPRLQVQHSLTVSPQGTLFIPRLGVFAVDRLTLPQLEAQIQQRLKTQLRDPVSVSVSLTRVRQVQVLVSGYVQQPGFYQVAWGTRLLEVLRRAGGVQDQGSVRRVRLRQGDRQQELDLLAFSYRGDLSANPALQGTEQIFIPPMTHQIALTGQVRQPGQYEFLPGESFQQLLQLAGGARPGADPQQLLRWPQGLNDGVRPLETLPLNHEQPLEHGDVFYLAERKLPAEAHTLTLYGQLQQPGVQNFRRGLTVQDALRLAGGPLPNADLSNLRISRSVAGGRQWLSLDLRGWLEGRNQDGETELQPGDILYLPEAFFGVRNLMELTSLLVGALGIVSVVINLSRSP